MRPRPAGRPSQRSVSVAGGVLSSRTPEARSLPGSEVQMPGRDAVRSDGGASLDSTALRYMRPSAAARSRAPRPSPRAATPSTQGATRSPRSVRSRTCPAESPVL